ncbi:36780_t:CDS:2, partial [Racocetra persica]
DEDPEGYRCKFDCIDKTVKSEVINMKFDELNQKNEVKIRIISKGSHKKKSFEYHKYDVIYDITSAYFSDNEDSKCKINKKYYNVPDNEKRVIDNHRWNESEIEIDQMFLILRNDID